ncbi:MAG TPA: sialidase family protein, partial [Thermomicrobiales bacterium]|nr:sialidase family protein [Thermomicrobiales bacterium]
MWLLTLILAILFGLGAFMAPVEAVSRVGVGQTSVSPLTVEGEPVTALGVEPVSGEARYLGTGGATWTHDETGGWRRTGVAPGHHVMVVDSRDDLLVWAGTPVDCYRGVEAPAPMVRSTDGGATWVEAGPAGAVPLASWMNTGIAVAHDCSGLLLSTDSGTTWSVPEGFPLGSQVT